MGKCLEGGSKLFLFQTAMPCHNLDVMNINFTLYQGVMEKSKLMLLCPQKTDSFLAGGSMKAKTAPLSHVWSLNQNASTYTENP